MERNGNYDEDIDQIENDNSIYNTNNVDHVKAEIEHLKKRLNNTDPINSKIAKTLNAKIWQIFSELENNALYVGTDELIIQTDVVNEVYSLPHFPAAIIASYLTNRSCLLIVGSPGTGKTATVRFISRYITQSSILDMNNIVHCDSEIASEDWIGIKDPKDVINGTGDWQIKWFKWIEDNGIKTIDLIIDEVNRSNANFQNKLLTILADAKIQMGEFNKTLPELRTFMTMNHIDEKAGTINVIPLQYALLDRITQSVQVPHSNRLAKDLFRECRDDERELGYNDDDLITPILSIRELRIATILANKIPVDEDAHLLALYLSQDATLCILAPYYDKTLLENPRFSDSKGGLCENCHFKINEICKLCYGGSIRTYKDLIALGKSYAFILGLKSVNKHIIYAIAEDVISHRIIINDDRSSSNIIAEKSDHRKIVKTKYIEFCWKNLKKRAKAEELYNKLINGDGDEKDLQILKNLSTDDLYIRLNLLKTVSIGENIEGSMDEYKIFYSCANLDYKSTMKQVNKIKEYIENTNNSNDLTKAINSLKDFREKLPSNPLKKLMRKIISSAIHKAESKMKLLKLKSN